MQKIDYFDDDGNHIYWSTHCRHDDHKACNAVELARGVPRRPAECKKCGAQCVCTCHDTDCEWQVGTQLCDRRGGATPRPCITCELLLCPYHLNIEIIDYHSYHQGGLPCIMKEYGWY